MPLRMQVQPNRFDSLLCQPSSRQGGLGRLHPRWYHGDSDPPREAQWTFRSRTGLLDRRHWGHSFHWKVLQCWQGW